MPPEPACDESPALSTKHVDAIWDYILKTYPEITPSGDWSFEDTGPKANGATDQWGNVTIHERYESMTCLTSTEFNTIFGTVLHEMMHSTDGYFTRRWDIFTDNRLGYTTDHHSSITTRVSYEQSHLLPPTGPMWGYTEENQSKAKPKRNMKEFKDLLKDVNGCECES